MASRCLEVKPLKYHIEAFVIVKVHPLGCSMLNVIEVIPVMLRQAFVGHRTVEALNVSVLLRLLPG